MKRNIGTVHVLAMEHLYVMLMMMMDKKINQYKVAKVNKWKFFCWRLIALFRLL